MESEAGKTGAALRNRIPTLWRLATKSRRFLRFGWAQSFGIAHLAFLGVVTFAIASAKDPFVKIGISMYVMIVDFAATPVVLACGGIYSNYLAVGAILLLGTLQWCLIGWFVGFTVRSVRRAL
jgi:hypothetical protein